MSNPDYSAMLAAIDFFRHRRILCVGDTMLDRYIYGDVERISPEAPIPVFAVRREENMLGAAGNVARNIAALGAQVEFHTSVGNDKNGLAIKGLLDKESRITSHIHTEGRTTVKTRYIAGNQQLMRVDVDSHSSPLEMPTDLEQFDAAIISDYNKGTCHHIAMQMFNDMAIPCVVDTKSWIGNYKGAYVITPNLGELADSVDWFSQNNATDEKVEDAARYLCQQHTIENVLVTRAAKGMTLQTSDNQTYHIPAMAREVYDVVGAGDTVAAILALGIGCDLTILEAAMIANIAGGIVVGKRGTASCTSMELKTALLSLMKSTLN